LARSGLKRSHPLTVIKEAIVHDEKIDEKVRAALPTAVIDERFGVPLVPVVEMWVRRPAHRPEEQVLLVEVEIADSLPEIAGLAALERAAETIAVVVRAKVVMPAAAIVGNVTHQVAKVAMADAALRKIADRMTALTMPSRFIRRTPASIRWCRPSASRAAPSNFSKSREQLWRKRIVS
jgi:hypothetical protein